jgi:peptidoglycan hydrolase-like amidase
MGMESKIINVTVTRKENAEYHHCSIGDTVQVEFEQYVAAVVASEVGNSHIEACKAQAVAARTFAISRGVLRGRAISDDSSSAQAYRAARFNSTGFSRALAGAKETAGEILVFNGEPARAVYSANNGGRTTSSQERWGSTFPYLIAQDDPWDAADGKAKYGHGVGMSQRGAMWAAKNGTGYRDILAFYYPGTAIAKNYGEVIPMVLTNEKADTIIELANACMGYPYVFGAIGEACTPANRKRRARSDYPTIVSKCQVLTGKADTCNGCKYQGQQI